MNGLGSDKKKLPFWHCQPCASIINYATHRELHIIVDCAALEIVFQRFLLRWRDIPWPLRLDLVATAAPLTPREAK